MKKLFIIAVVFVIVGVIPALKFVGDSVLFGDALAKGLGRAMTIGLLSCIGLFYKRNKTLGFGIAAATFSVLAIIAEIKQGTL